MTEDKAPFSLASAQDGSLVGQFLIAMPNMSDPRFERSVIYVCAHSEDGAMGLLVNKQADNITFPELLDQLSINAGPTSDQIRVHAGGPVETSRGFVLHSSDYFSQNSTLKVSDGVGLTATIDILRSMATGDGPDQALLALGYAGWGAGQLEDELKAGGWLNCPGNETLIFAPDLGAKWEQALGTLGVNPAALSSVQGHA